MVDGNKNEASNWSKRTDLIYTKEVNIVQIFQNIATVVGCFSACIALSVAIVKPFRKWVVESFTRQSQYKELKIIVDNIAKKMDTSLENDRKLEQRLTRVEKNVLDNEADRLRSELFDCGNRCRRRIRLHPEEMDHVRAVYKKYSDGLHQNGSGEAEFKFITDYYNHQSFSEYHEHNS